MSRTRWNLRTEIEGQFQTVARAFADYCEEQRIPMIALAVSAMESAGMSLTGSQMMKVKRRRPDILYAISNFVRDNDPLSSYLAVLLRMRDGETDNDAEDFSLSDEQRAQCEEFSERLKAEAEQYNVPYLITYATGCENATVDFKTRHVSIDGPLSDDEIGALKWNMVTTMFIGGPEAVPLFLFKNPGLLAELVSHDDRFSALLLSCMRARANVDPEYLTDMGDGGEAQNTLRKLGARLGNVFAVLGSGSRDE